MHHIVPPFCLLLAIAMMVAGYCLWSIDPPQATVDLYRAAASGDEQYREAAEEQLRRRQRNRKILVGSLFAGGGLMVVIAFFSMRPASGIGKRS